MKTKNIIIAMAILTVVLTLVILLCAFTSPDDSNEDGVFVVSAYYSEDALRDAAKTNEEVPTIKEKLDGSQKPVFITE
jgi:hypothetical protein